MSNLKQPWKEQYSETEAAAALGISLARLYQLLDEHIFSEPGSRPRSIEFTSSDLVLLSFWNKNSSQSTSRRVLQMPKRK